MAIPAYTRQDELRADLIAFLEDYGLTLKHVAKTCGFGYWSLVKFKNGQANVSQKRGEFLALYIKGYRDAVDLITRMGPPID